MSSLTRLMRLPAVTDTATLLTRVDPALDAFTQQRVDAAATAAYERGHRDGAAAATTAAEASADRFVAAVDHASREILAELRAMRAADASADVALASQIAEVVLGREPHDGAQALLGRVEDALAAVDDLPLVVSVHPDDAAVIAAGLRAEGVRVEADPTLDAGEARIDGPWARAELTRQAAWDAVHDALAAAEVQTDA